jgi:dolichol-phosphate mannosyltransferase
MEDSNSEIEAELLDDDSYSVLLPTYNEKQNIPIIIAMLMKVSDEKYIIIVLKIRFNSSLNLEIVIVDDNSPDGTQLAIKQLQKIYGEERIVF